MIFSPEQISSATKNKRNEYLVEIRKKKTKELLNKKRMKDSSSHEQNLDKIISFETSNIEDICEKYFSFYKNEDFENLAKLVKDLREQVTIVDNNFPTMDLRKANVTKSIINLLEKKYIEHVILQREAAWFLTNLSARSSDDTNYLIAEGCIAKFLELFESSDDDIVECALFALGNICGESIAIRDELLKYNILKKILKLLYGANLRTINTIKAATWLISNLLRGKPYPPFEYSSSMLKLLGQLIHNHNEEIQFYTLWGLCYISELSDNTSITSICSIGVIPKVIKLLQTKNEMMILPGLRIIGNVATGDADQTKLLVDNGVFSVLGILLDHRKKIIRKDACWTLSNILVDLMKSMHPLIDMDIFGKLIHILLEDDIDIKIEATHCINNFIEDADLNQIQTVISKGIIEALVANLDVDYPSALICACLDCLSRFLEHGEDLKKLYNGSNPFVVRLLDCGESTTLENLQNHKDDKVYDKAVKFMKTFFVTYDKEEDIQE